MTIVSSTLNQLSSAVAPSFMPPLTFAPTFGTVLQAVGFYLISILRLALLLPNREGSRFGARVLKGKISQFDNLYHLCKQSLVAVPSNGLCEAGWRRFVTCRPFGHFFGGFPRTCSLG
jgi:hypothetical protein